MKAVKGVFYVTQSQHFWAETMLLPVWLAMPISILLLRWLKPETMTWSRWIKETGGAIGVLAGLVSVALLAFGDQIMALIFTGSIVPPPEPNPSRSTTFDTWFAVIVVGITVFNIFNWWRNRRHSDEVGS
jgi:hypothetical protein